MGILLLHSSYDIIVQLKETHQLRGACTDPFFVKCYFIAASKTICFLTTSNTYTIQCRKWVSL